MSKTPQQIIPQPQPWIPQPQPIYKRLQQTILQPRWIYKRPRQIIPQPQPWILAARWIYKKPQQTSPKPTRETRLLFEVFARTILSLNTGVLCNLTHKYKLTKQEKLHPKEVDFIS